jgi:hypothetical protein
MTQFRLLNIHLLLGFGIMKAVYSFMGNSIAPTTIELVVGSVLAAAYVLLTLYPLGRHTNLY